MTDASENPYAFYNASLAGQKPALHESDPQPGFYRMKWKKDGPWVLVAAWLDDDDQLVGFMDGQTVDRDRLEERWTYFAQHPVQEDLWRAVNAGEQSWPDDAPAAGLGHNSGDDGEQDKHAILTSQLAALEKQADAILETPVETEEEAEARAALAKGLDKIGSDAEKTRKVEKQPHLDAGKAVDAHWNKLRDAAKDKSSEVKRTLNAYMREQDRLKREEAERLRREAMEQAKRSDDQDAVAEKMAEAQALETKKTTVGTTGAKVRMREVVTGVIVDWDKVLADPQIRKHPEFMSFVDQLCTRAVRAGKSIDGVERKEEQVAA